MSLQAYLDNIKAKTGKGPDDFKKLAAKKGLLKEGVKAGEIVAWLKKDFDLGHGHAMAIYTLLKGTKENKESPEKKLVRHFTGKKSVWRPLVDSLIDEMRSFGDDVSLDPVATYISILRGDRKMAIIQVMVAHIDVGIKLKGVPSNKRFQPAGAWNAMMTHRIRISDGIQVDKELRSWLRSAYEQNA